MSQINDLRKVAVFIAIFAVVALASVATAKADSYTQMALTSPKGATGFASSSPDVTTTPEPATMLLLGTGLLGIAGVLRKRFSK